MECLMHQVLVAMLAATPAPDAVSADKSAEIKPRTAISAPARIAPGQVVLGKKGKNGTQVAQVAMPRPAAN